MKIRQIFYFPLLILLIGCSQKKTSVEIVNELKGKVFELSSPDYQQIRTVEFKDSTYTIYEDGIQNLEWRAPILSKDILIMDRQKIRIEKESDSVYKCSLETDNGKTINFKLTRKISNWSENSLVGTWMLDKHFKERANDDENVENGIDTTDFEPYPIFKIDNRKLVYKQLYDSIASKFDIIKTDRYMAISLENPEIFGSKYLKIMSQKDSLLYVDISDKLNDSNDSTQIGFMKLIKIRLPTPHIIQRSDD